MTNDDIHARLIQIGEQGRLCVLCATLKLPEGKVRETSKDGDFTRLEAAEVERLRKHFSS